MAITFHPAREFEVRVLSALMDDAFTDYVGGVVEMTSERFADFLARDRINLNLSQVVVRDGIPQAMALIARQGRRSRLAVMGVSRSVARQGLGRALLERLLDEAVQRTDSSFELECFELNTAAIPLYEKYGFKTVRKLLSYTCNSVQEEHDDGLEEVEARVVGEVLARCGLKNLPWQVASETIGQYSPPALAYRLGPAAAVISDPRQEMIMIHSIVTEEKERRRGWAGKLLRAMAAQHGSDSWRVPALCPEELDVFFPAVGFTRTGLDQVHMMLPLSARP